MTHEPVQKELFHVAGDQPDPSGTGLRGVSPGFDFTATALGHPMLLYRIAGKEIVLEADVYQLPGEPLHIHIICPLCLINGRQNALRIVQGQKQLSYDPQCDPPPFPGWSSAQMRETFPRGLGGTLNVEPFRCTWEEAPELRRSGGFSCCEWSVAIERNLVRPAR